MRRLLFHRQRQPVAQGQGERGDARVVRQRGVEVLQDFEAGGALGIGLVEDASVQQQVVYGDDGIGVQKTGQAATGCRYAPRFGNQLPAKPVLATRMAI